MSACDIFPPGSPEYAQCIAASQSTASNGQQINTVYWGTSFASSGMPRTVVPGVSAPARQVKTRGGMVNVAPDTPNDPVDRSKSTDEAKDYITQLLNDAPQEFYKIGDSMVKMGYLKAGYDPTQVEAIWAGAVDKAAQFYKNGAGDKLTVAQVLSLYSPANAGKGFSDLAGTGIGASRLTPVTHTSTDVSSRMDIKHAAESVAQSELGRDLTEAQLDRLVTKVQGAQASSPTISTVTTDAQGNTTTKTTGGLGEGGAAQILQDAAQNDPNYAEHQAAAFYAPLLFQALGATV